MDSSQARPSTPPPYFPLTPPPTDGTTKFVDVGRVEPIAQRSFKASEGEDLDVFFNELEEGTCIEQDAISPTDTEFDTDPSVVSSEYPESEFPVTAQAGAIEGLIPFLVSANTQEVIVSEPFEFLDLPISIRNMVYEHLLIVPALVCVRQNYRTYQDGEGPFMYPERRQQLTGITNAAAQIVVNGRQVHFSRFRFTNANIMCTKKQIFAETKTILYGKNEFDIGNPSKEMSPAADFSVRLFPAGCQRLVTKFSIRIRSFYNLAWLLSRGHIELKNFYRGLTSLTVILELESPTKGFGRIYARDNKEPWAKYTQRLQCEMLKDILNGPIPRINTIPHWIHLRVLFIGESYVDQTHLSVTGVDMQQSTNQDEIRQGLQEAWESMTKAPR